MEPSQPHPGQFPDTHWTLIQRIETDDESLHEWCRGYWLPVRNYILAQGKNQDDANDLTQSFFERLLSRDREKMLPNELSGAFRAYLKRSVKNFLTDSWRASMAQRRGSGSPILEIDDNRLPDPGASADTAFDRAWVLTIIQHALDTLEAEMEKSGSGKLFQALSPFLDGSSAEQSQAEIASQLQMSDGSLRVALHRLRQRFRHHIEEEIRQTVSTKAELEEEIRNLLTLWS